MVSGRSDSIVKTAQRPLGAFCRRAFSLVEVVVALGIFGVLILAVVGLLTPTLRSVGETTDADMIPRLPGLIRGELTRSPDNLAWWRDWEPDASNPLLRFYIDEDGLQVRPASVIGADAETTDFRLRFYGVALRPAVDADGVPDTFAPNDAYRSYQVLIYWPASRLTGPRPNGTFRGVPLDQSAAEVARLNQRTFHLTLRR